MNHLVIYAHPSENSLNADLRDTVIEQLKEQEENIKVRHLYEMDFKPILSLDDLNGQRRGQVADDVHKEQDFIRWADCITFIHPVWWTGLPAILKGYIDRVFTYGFAYRYDQGVQKGLLKGKQAVIINTQGKSAEEYAQIGMDKALQLTSETGIYEYSGLEIKKHFFFDSAEHATPEIISEWKRQIKTVFKPSISHLITNAVSQIILDGD